jgi:hypothetical protein
VEGTGENHRSGTSHWQTLSHNVVSSTPCLSGIRTHISSDSSDCICRETFYKLTNQKQELPVVAMFVNGSGQNEQSL